MCDVPVLPQSWKGYFKHVPFIDESTFDKGHLIFTAAPVISVGMDPIQCRHGMLAGDPTVAVPADVLTRASRNASSADKVRSRRNIAPAIAPMPAAASAFVDIIARSNVLRSQHPAYRRDRARRLAFCSMLRAAFGIQDEAILKDAFDRACVGVGDMNDDHDTLQSIHWAFGAPPNDHTFSIRKLLCDASATLHKAGDKATATRAARLATAFWKIETSAT